jgi:hypothetical protein
MEKEKDRFEQEILKKENIETQRQELLMQMEEQKKENLNLKSQYDMDIYNFKNELEKKNKSN